MPFKMRNESVIVQDKPSDIDALLSLANTFANAALERPSSSSGGSSSFCYDDDEDEKGFTGVADSTESDPFVASRLSLRLHCAPNEHAYGYHVSVREIDTRIDGRRASRFSLIDELVRLIGDRADRRFRELIDREIAASLDALKLIDYIRERIVGPRQPVSRSLAILDDLLFSDIATLGHKCLVYGLFNEETANFLRDRTIFDDVVYNLLTEILVAAAISCQEFSHRFDSYKLLCATVLELSREHIYGTRPLYTVISGCTNLDDAHADMENLANDICAQSDLSVLRDIGEPAAEPLCNDNELLLVDPRTLLMSPPPPPKETASKRAKSTIDDCEAVVAKRAKKTSANDDTNNNNNTASIFDRLLQEDFGGEQQQTQPTSRSEYVGQEYSVGETRFISRKGLFVSIFEDYTLLTNHDFTPFLQYATPSLKNAIMPRWRYVMHVSHGMTPSVTRQLLHSRVMGGQILAYKYLECSIEGNQCVYYGIVPTIQQTIDNTSDTCRFSMQAVYPRKLYVYLEKASACMCSSGCIRWSALLSDSKTKFSFCGKNIPWSKLYVMMGDLDEDFQEVLKEVRDCVVCAQCFECSKSANYCRKHRICKHKHAVTFNGKIDSLAVPLNSSKIKKCQRVRKV